MKARAAVLVLLDFFIAGAVALHVWRQYRIWNIDDSRPPGCANYYGDNLSCSTSDVTVTLVAVAVLVVILLGFLWFQRRRGWI